MAEVTESGWQPLPRRAAVLSVLSGAAAGLLPLPSWLLFQAKLGAGTLPPWLATLLLCLLVGAVFAGLGYLRWRCTAWRLDAQGLRLRRGWLWRREILVPRSRVQHLDIERGPLERRRGLATLVLHTAGTRQHALRQSGLDDAEAVALRDALVPEAERHDDAL